LAFTEDIKVGQEYRYKQSIAINELLFDDASPLPRYQNGPRAAQVAGTVYPAMQMRASADNLAIWPAFVDDGLRIKSVRYILIEAADLVLSSYTFLTLAISRTFSGSDIIWQDDLPPENRRRSHIALEGRPLAPLPTGQELRAMEVAMPRNQFVELQTRSDRNFGA
jgi:hypothetical protein